MLETMYVARVCEWKFVFSVEKQQNWFVACKHSSTTFTNNNNNVKWDCRYWKKKATERERGRKRRKKPITNFPVYWQFHCNVAFVHLLHKIAHSHTHSAQCTLHKGELPDELLWSDRDLWPSVIIFSCLGITFRRQGAKLSGERFHRFAISQIDLLQHAMR